MNYSEIEKTANVYEIRVKKLHPDAVIPTKAHADDAGFDLVAVEDVIIEPGETVLVRTGLAFELPKGFEMQVRPRSGVTLRTKLRVQLGTIDSNYRGEVGVIVDNLNVVEGGETCGYYRLDNVFYLDHCIKAVKGSYFIRKGDRIAQAVIQHLPAVEMVEVEELSESERGDGGFGSTGTKIDGGETII